MDRTLVAGEAVVKHTGRAAGLGCGACFSRPRSLTTNGGANTIPPRSGNPAHPRRSRDALRFGEDNPMRSSLHRAAWLLVVLVLVAPPLARGQVKPLASF